MKRKKYAIYAKKSFVMIKTKKSEIIAVTPENLEELLIANEIPVIFHNGSAYDYHFTIKQLAEESEGEFYSLGENTEKYITSSVPFKKEKSEIITTYKLKFIYS